MLATACSKPRVNNMVTWSQRDSIKVIVMVRDRPRVTKVVIGSQRAVIFPPADREVRAIYTYERAKVKMRRKG